MTIKRAKVLNSEQFEKLKAFVKSTNNPERDLVIVLFSYKVGMRSCEIAGITWEDLIDVEGNIYSDQFILRGSITKSGKDRALPMHPELRDALIALRNKRPNDKRPVYAEMGGYMTAHNLTMYLIRVYKRLGYVGASSHSGRRSFLTKLARVVNTYGCSIKDVQNLAGHARMSTTERYIELSPQAIAMVNSQ